jgi:hypothetical protein
MQIPSISAMPGETNGSNVANATIGNAMRAVTLAGFARPNSLRQPTGAAWPESPVGFGASDVCNMAVMLAAVR